MKSLSINEVTYKEIEWLDRKSIQTQGLQSFIEEVYSLTFNNAIANGTIITAEIKKELDEYEQVNYEEFMQEFKSGNSVESCQFFYILIDLCKLGYLEPGNYLINIWW